MQRVTGEYGTYDTEKKVWRGESEDEFYAYAVMDASAIFFAPGSSVWMFAQSLEEAMKTAANMMQKDGIDQVEIGVPSGDIIQIDARWVDLSTQEDE
tara:strand:- start:209 stop:499 length:291 start_codon:yes stop_codon:yes gene_type:complete